jgi:hypothetical protein
MTHAGHLAYPLILAVLSLPSFALADEIRTSASSTGSEIDSEHIFGFSEGSDIGSQGEREIESVTIGSFGKIGNYSNIDNETSFRYGLTNQVRLSIGTLTDFYGTYNSPGLSNRSIATFSGLIGEMRVNIVDRMKSPFGMSLSINPQWRQIDPFSGETTGNYAIPATLLIDKEVISEKFFVATNLIYTPSFLRVNEMRGHDDAFTVIAAGTYALGSNIFAGMEIRHENLAQNGTFIAHALFVGPSMFYRFSQTFTAKIAWAAQIPDVGSNALDFASYERHQIELQIAYNF